MKGHILLAYGFDQGIGKALTDEAIAEEIKLTNKLAWVHMDVNHPGTKQWLKNETQYLDRFAIDALLAGETRPRMVQIGEGALLILRGVNLNENADPEDMVSFRLWVDPHRIISVCRRQLQVVGDIEESIKAGKAPLDTGDFICTLVSKLFERIEPVLTDLDDLTDEVEEKVLEKADISLRENIVNVRKKAIKFRRYMAPQRDAIGQLRMSELHWLDENNKRHLQESYNHVTRYVEDLDAIRERAQIVKDELANILSDRLNKNMYVLSVIAAIFLPLGFLTGLLGINIAGIPGADYAQAFWVFCGILIVIVTAQIVVFKKLEWF